MRFSIRQLLLIFPAFFLATFVAMVGITPTCSHPRWIRGINDLRRVQVTIDVLTNYQPDFEPSIDEINQWLAGKLPTAHPLFQIAGEHPNADPWHRPYRCIRVIGPSIRPGESFGFYSLGQDGISKSEGNDADDMNSWNPDCRLWYIREYNNNGRLTIGIVGAFLTPFAYWGSLVCGRLVKVVFATLRSRVRFFMRK